MRSIICILFLALSLAAASAAGYRDITARDAFLMIQKNRNIFILDVRTPEEFRNGHLSGAILIPLSDMERRFREVPRNRPVLVYCTVGARSAAVASTLARSGHPQVYNMADGVMGWYRNRFPLQR